MPRLLNSLTTLRPTGLGMTLCSRSAVQLHKVIALRRHSWRTVGSTSSMECSTQTRPYFASSGIRQFSQPVYPTYQAAQLSTKHGESSSAIAYKNLATLPSIAEAHFDLSKIPVPEHAQILRDFILVPDYLSQEEHDMMVEAATRKLKRALGKQVRYEDGHFDGVITRYRECSATDWGAGPAGSQTTGATEDMDRHQRTQPAEVMQSIKHEFFPPHWKWVAPHVLELEAGKGGIKPHVDHLDASGEVVAGLCLGSSAVMELIHERDPQKQFRVLLPKRCFYFQRDSVRYNYKHGIPIELEDHQFKGTVIPKERRISVMLRVGGALLPLLYLP
ncbi:Alpha-ketoglutarate-dependent dioxygenase alkB 7, mitochondrial [Mortierella polycephala]|uniref:Alpha-ketoglutarate-dependent dioxygenase alkB 7, mitochondrial n=1 Tax=Mortierella polycephala TaxID=41804 RepID=A0A9P6U2D8_9FUNG|nr:Alpha-ketoglutarate-dependent dioxygenase alkB 7, mitochondrial [Mortierella polycephala]